MNNVGRINMMTVEWQRIMGDYSCGRNVMEAFVMFLCRSSFLLLWYQSLHYITLIRTNPVQGSWNMYIPRNGKRQHYCNPSGLFLVTIEPQSIFWLALTSWQQHQTSNQIAKQSIKEYKSKMVFYLPLQSQSPPWWSWPFFLPGNILCKWDLIQRLKNTPALDVGLRSLFFQTWPAESFILNIF